MIVWGADKAYSHMALPARDAIAKGERLPFALASAVLSLSIIVVIIGIGAQTKSMNPDVAAALIGAALLSLPLFPTITGVLLQRIAVKVSTDDHWPVVRTS